VILVSTSRTSATPTAEDLSTALAAQSPDEEGESALAVAREHKGDLQLLVTDVVMPGMNGKELADRLTAERPDLRVLYISGYAEHAVVRQGVLVEGIAFLSKPFDLSELARTVREVLDKASVAG